jgi:Domain of unknown function (DUF4115)
VGRHVSSERRRSLRSAVAIAVTGIIALLSAAGFAGYEVWLRTRVPSPAPARQVGSVATVTLTVTVTGARCQVFVGVPGGDILVNRTLVHGQTVRFDDPVLNVVLSDAGAVQVAVNGRPRPAGTPGTRAEFAAVKS